MIIAIVNRKGGVGKTTTTFNLGTALSKRARRVLLVDLDPQKASLTHLAQIQNPDYTVADALSHYLKTRTPAPIDAMVIPLASNLDLLAGSADLDNAEIRLSSVLKREHVLKGALGDVRARYDTVLIDCGPSMGVLVVNAMTAADEVIIPVESAYMAAVGLEDLLDTVADVRREEINGDLRVGGIILTRVKGTRHGREIADGVRAAFEGTTIPVLGEVKESTKVNEASQARQSILDYAEGDAAAKAYTKIADALAETWAATPVGGSHG
jgi:chromosome partitioning protein